MRASNRPFVQTVSMQFETRLTFPEDGNGGEFAAEQKPEFSQTASLDIVASHDNFCFTVVIEVVGLEFIVSHDKPPCSRTCKLPFPGNGIILR